jgi:hypothetical protein
MGMPRTVLEPSMRSIFNAEDVLIEGRSPRNKRTIMDRTTSKEERATAIRTKHSLN